MNRKVKSCPLVLWLSVLAIGPGFGEEIDTAPQDMAANASLTTMDIQYKGLLISDTCVPGEGKSAGITVEYSKRRVVLDAHKQKLPFRTPFIDHAMIYPHPGGRKQIISFRTINRSQTTGESTTPEELERSGIHYSELIYDKDHPTPWGFDGTRR